MKRAELGQNRPCRIRLLVACVVFLGFVMPATSSSGQPVGRAVEFNGRMLDGAALELLRPVEAVIGPVPSGRYWYDAMSGGAGVLGGPAAAYLGPGLALGGPLPASASGGGDGRTTGVFVNGRELHPLDVGGLQRHGPVYPGRYWWDRFGNVGLEGGPMLFNFFALLQQQERSSRSTYRPGARSGESTYVGKGCVAVHGRLRASDEGSSYSYYGGC